MRYIDCMRHTVCTAVLLGAMVLPAQAEEDGPSLMERGAELFLEGLMREMEPALDELQGFAEGMQPALRQFMDEMGPAFADVLGKVGDLSAYHAPEILPNGDIIMRRKTPVEESLDPEEGEIDI